MIRPGCGPRHLRGALWAAIGCLLFCAVDASASKLPPLRAGDLLFQTSRSSQSQAIQKATGSEFSHMGIVLLRGGGLEVLEAVQPVRFTPVDEWIRRGIGGRVVVKRLRNRDPILTEAVVEAMRVEGTRWLGRDYDFYFEWSDERIYCSELVYKLYQRATGIEIGRLQRLAEFDLSSLEVHTKLRERFGDHPPLEETVVSPATAYGDEDLRTIYDGSPFGPAAQGESELE